MTTTTDTQLSLLEGLTRQEEGREHVKLAHGVWIQEMRQVAFNIYLTQGFVTTDDIHRYAEVEGLHPEKNTAFTGIFRGSEWKDIGFMQSALKTNHGRLIRKWVWYLKVRG